MASCLSLKSLSYFLIGACRVYLLQVNMSWKEVSFSIRQKDFDSKGNSTTASIKRKRKQCPISFDMSNTKLNKIRLFDNTFKSISPISLNSNEADWTRLIYASMPSDTECLKSRSCSIASQVARNVVDPRAITLEEELLDSCSNLLNDDFFASNKIGYSSEPVNISQFVVERESSTKVQPDGLEMHDASATFDPKESGQSYSLERKCEPVCKRRKKLLVLDQPSTIPLSEEQTRVKQGRMPTAGRCDGRRNLVGQFFPGIDLGSLSIGKCSIILQNGVIGNICATHGAWGVEDTNANQVSRHELSRETARSAGDLYSRLDGYPPFEIDFRSDVGVTVHLLHEDTPVDFEPLAIGVDSLVTIDSPITNTSTCNSLLPHNPKPLGWPLNEDSASGRNAVDFLRIYLEQNEPDTFSQASRRMNRVEACRAFLGCLEAYFRGAIRLYQKRPFSRIFIERGREY